MANQSDRRRAVSSSPLASPDELARTSTSSCPTRRELVCRRRKAGKEHQDTPREAQSPCNNANVRR